MGAIAYPLSDLKVWRLIGTPRHETANGATTSAKTHGSGGNTGGIGICDRAGFDFALVIFARSMVNSTASTNWQLFHQSGAGTLCASATSIASAGVNGLVGASGNYHVYRVDLRDKKRYLNAKITTCGTCGYPDAWAILFNGNMFPPSFGSKATVRNV